MKVDLKPPSFAHLKVDSFDSRDAGTEHVEEALLRWAAQVRARWRVFARIERSPNAPENI